MKSNSVLSRSDIVAKLKKIFLLDTLSQPQPLPSFLVIGYGNSNHGDDAIGFQVATEINKLGLENVAICTLEQLVPELSTKLAKFDYAIFVKACQMKTPIVKVRNLKACGLETTGSSVPGSNHSWLPCSLLALTQSVYGHHPQSWWVEIAAQDFATGHSLSLRAKQNIQTALDQIEKLIHQSRSRRFFKSRNLLETFPSAN